MDSLHLIYDRYQKISSKASQVLSNACPVYVGFVSLIDDGRSAGFFQPTSHGLSGDQTSQVFPSSSLTKSLQSGALGVCSERIHSVSAPYPPKLHMACYLDSVYTNTIRNTNTNTITITKAFALSAPPTRG